MNVNCKQCGRKVPREGKTRRDYLPGRFTYTARYPNPRAGMPAVSTHMCALDPDGLFCTMRCAVRYAVNAVKKGTP